MKIGFTGTRNEITTKQFDDLFHFINQLENVTMCHHGDCVGADATFHDICESLGLPITIHPPVEDKLRAWKKSDLIEEPKTYLVRNRMIVDSSDLLIGVPRAMKETRGGTWYTINYAKKKGVPQEIIWPK